MALFELVYSGFENLKLRKITNCLNCVEPKHKSKASRHMTLCLIFQTFVSSIFKCYAVIAVRGRSYEPPMDALKKRVIRRFEITDKV